MNLKETLDDLDDRKEMFLDRIAMLKSKSKFYVQEHVVLAITNMAIMVISAVNKHKDRVLADRLHELASLYQTRPEEGWTYHE